MTIWKYAAALAAMIAGTPSMQAKDTITGRWALDPASCATFAFGAAQPLIVTDDAVRWNSDACRIARVYKTGDTVHIQAICWGDNGERSIPVSLRPHAGRLSVVWDRGKRGELRRCQ